MRVWILALALVAAPAGASPSEGEGPSLGVTMSRVQDLAADLWFALDAGNLPLANYFVHELEEAFEDVQEHHVTHNEVALAPHLKVVLGEGGAIESLEAARKRGEGVPEAYDALTKACSSCHAATGHPYLKVGRSKVPRSVMLSWPPE